MRVELLGYVDDIEKIIAACSKATRNQPADKLLRTLGKKESRELVGRVLAKGHENISEFAYFIFSISGVSRVLTHQLVRHRIASYLQMSSREVDLSDVRFITPPEVTRDKQAAKLFDEAVNKARENYSKIIARGIKLEDARYLLPDSIETHISVAINGRSLNNLFGLRLCGRAQWEIRQLASLMRAKVVKIAPSLFWTQPRPCVRKGACTEGKGSCGFRKTDRFTLERNKFLKGFPHE